MRLRILGMARLASTRLPNKMIRPFRSGGSLFEVYAYKLSILPYEPVVALFPGDAALVDIAKEWGLTIVERQEGREGLQPASKIFHFLDKLDADAVMWINGCLPFLRPHTIMKAAETFEREQPRAMTAVRIRNNWFWDPLDGSPINNKDPEQISTQMSPPIYESAHAFHIFRPEEVLERGRYWGLTGPDDPRLFVIPDDECVDVDDEESFIVADTLKECANPHRIFS